MVDEYWDVPITTDTDAFVRALLRTARRTSWKLGDDGSDGLVEHDALTEIPDRDLSGAICSAFLSLDRPERAAVVALLRRYVRDPRRFTTED